MRPSVRLLFILASVVLFPAIYATGKSGVKKEIYVGVAPNPHVTLTSIGGKGTADFMELFQKGADEFKKLYGHSISLKLFPSPKFLFKSLEDKTLDFSLMALPLFLAAKKRGIPVSALFTIKTRDLKPVRFCIYVHKDSGIKNLKQLKGKKFAADFPVFLSQKDALPPEEGYFSWIVTKKALEKEGIKTPFKEFFMEYKVLPAPGESLAYAVVLKRFDAAMSNTTFMEALKNYDDRFSDLIPLSCIEGTSDSPIVYRTDMNQELLKQMKEFFRTPKKSKTLNSISKEFKGITFGSAEDKAYDLYFKWLKEAQQKGWFQEFNNIMKDTPRPKKK